jgi:hypothetical protein
MFKGVRKIESLHPLVMLFAVILDLDTSEITSPKKTFRGQIHDLKTIFRKQGTGLGHVKILVNPTGQKTPS